MSFNNSIILMLSMIGALAIIYITYKILDKGVSKVNNNEKIQPYINAFSLVGLVIVIITVVPFVVQVLGIPFKQNDFWSFAGSIIGGGMTLLGVVMTISWQDNKRKEDLAVQFKPIIMVKRKLDQDGNFKIFNKIHGSNLVELNFELDNIGRGEAIDLTVVLENKDAILSQIKTLPCSEKTTISIQITPSNYYKTELKLITSYTDLYGFDKRKTITDVVLLQEPDESFVIVQCTNSL